MTSKRFKFFISSNKKKIRYQFLNKEKDLFIIFFHGLMSDITGEKPSTFRKFCRKKKIGFLAFEYSGHGKSSGEFTSSNISKWTNDAKQLIKAKLKKNKSLIFVGSSMGSWIALNLFPVFKKQIKGFVGISSAPEFLEKLMWKKFTKKIKKIIMTRKIYYLKKGEWTYPITKQLIMNGRKNKVLNKKINLNIPITLFHGLKDEIVPLTFSKKILKIFPKAKKKLIKIKNGDHSLSKKNDLKKICKELNHIIFDHV
jgi:pimeloyl-ACP methyl ester carboxylesterase